MTTSPKAVFFDMDGVIVHSYWVWFHLLNQTAHEWGYRPVEHDLYQECWGQSTTADRDTFFPNHEVEDVEDFYDRNYRKHLEHLEVPEEVPRVFERVRELGLKSAVCTNTQASLASVIVERSGASPDVVVGGNDVPEGKPAPDMLLKAAELLDVGTNQAWMVGDSHYDRDAARAAGVYFVGVGIDGEHRLEHVGEILSLLEKTV